MGRFAAAPADVYRTTLEVLRAEFLIPIPIADEARLIFSSDLLRDTFVGVPSRYRISGNVVFDGERSVLTLYKYLQVLEGTEWKARPSDLALEARVLAQIRARLNASPKN